MECNTVISINLPNEVYIKVFSYLNEESWLVCSSVCKQWQRCIDDEFWSKHFPTVPPSKGYSLKKSILQNVYIISKNQLERCFKIIFSQLTLESKFTFQCTFPQNLDASLYVTVLAIENKQIDLLEYLPKKQNVVTGVFIKNLSGAFEIGNNGYGKLVGKNVNIIYKFSDDTNLLIDENVLADMAKKRFKELDAQKPFEVNIKKHSQNCIIS